MKKSMYSLILTDEVVAEIDKLAYTRNTNRSNLVNQILAEYVSYVTPEQRMRQIFQRMEDLLNAGNDSLQVLMRTSDSMLSLRSPLAYKYNPTVRYSVELYRDASGGAFGELKAALRTQNSSLILYVNQFYRLWESVERRLIGPCEYRAEGGQFFRRLRLRVNAGDMANGLDEARLGELIAAYVRLFDQALKLYFQLLDDPQQAARQIESLYRRHLLSGGEII